jgi:fimbrial chaperone protein
VGYTATVDQVKVSARRAGALVILAAGLLAWPTAAHPGEFRVTPIRLDLAAGGKGSGVVNVVNEGQEPLSFQVQAREWTQDAEGKDVYTETSDLIFFPQLLTTAVGETKVIRVGTKAPPSAREKSYRLFIEEIPKRQDAAGAVVRIAIRFGVPIFRLPAVEKKEGLLEEAKVERGSFSVRIRNTGTVHLIVNELAVVGKDAAGEEVFREQPSGWYVLVGASRTQSVAIPAEVCGRIRTLAVSARCEELVLTKELTAGEGWCP